MYRLRPIGHVLDRYQELEKQEIYFAPMEELNDPMEGFRDIFWQGDKIVWKNLLINYIKSVEQFFAVALLLADTKEMNASDVVVNFGGNVRQYLPETKRLLQEIIGAVFHYPAIAALPEALAARDSPVRREELQLYLQSFQRLVLHCVSVVYQQQARQFRAPFRMSNAVEKGILDLLSKMPGLTNQLEKANPGMERSAQKMYQGVKLVSDSVFLAMKIDHPEMNEGSNYYFLLNEFTGSYLAKLETIVYPEAYIASFMNGCSNSAAWGHYAEAHTGVCLKFKVEETDEIRRFKLRTQTGAASARNQPIRKTFGVVAHELRPVIYQGEPPSVDFFNSLGRLTKHESDAFWYTDEQGNRSECGKALQENRDDWHGKYWETFHQGLLVKSKAWNYEEESRIILSGGFVDFSAKDSRKLTYEFNDLEAIVFGIKTKSADKVRIVKIIKDKCAKTGRAEFDFYQAFYSPWQDRIETQKITL
jgi:hypothetical protein